ncbi:hypothetical protein NXT3_PA00084 (plasmid) [Sinorhizobium fredii]|uniref:Uncharacterized protein n=1 Tax=Rhizobium fredii TaxID=380 RepID=A0A2L0HC77_RHIFR|nr:hypothetical protein NXT3_PA00084 [Sinorhizobium fredii]
MARLRWQISVESGAGGRLLRRDKSWLLSAKRPSVEQVEVLSLMGRLVGGEPRQGDNENPIWLFEGSASPQPLGFDFLRSSTDCGPSVRRTANGIA